MSDIPAKPAKKIPFFDPKLFWDVKYPTDEQFYGNSFFIIERILIRGDISDFLKVKEFYNISEIKEVLLKSRQISNKARAFFCIYFKLDLSQICLPEQLNQKLWSY